MLAKFENGYFLEVITDIDKADESQSIYSYHIYDEDFTYVDWGWTRYRSIEMYYPMNEIDYILKFCEPDDVNGKYELCPFDTMEEFEAYLKDFLAEDPDGEWILETQGTDDDNIRYFKTIEAARTIMLREVNENENGENVDIDDDYCTICGEEYYQSWAVYKRETFDTEKERIFDEIQKEFGRIDVGITQYAWELQDTCVIRYHVEKLEELVEQLKEMM